MTSLSQPARPVKLTPTQHRVLAALAFGDKIHFMPFSRSSPTHYFLSGSHEKVTTSAHAFQKLGLAKETGQYDTDRKMEITPAGRAWIEAHPYQEVKPPVLHWWRVDYSDTNPITPVTLAKATTDWVWFEDGRKTQIHSSYACYTPTLAEAKSILVTYHENAHRTALSRLQMAESYLKIALEVAKTFNPTNPA